MNKHILDPAEAELLKDAGAISARYDGAPVAIIVGGVTGNTRVNRTMIATVQAGRLRDILGLLQTAIAIESWKHMRDWK